jgi:arylsulfatase A-like enzyme
MKLNLWKQRKPNVIWVFGDQHRGQALGYRGDPNVRTPNIDNLARNGYRFDSAVAGAPWCCPFRGAMLTGLYPHQCGVTRTPMALDPTIPTITDPFKQAGYHSAYIGKWHLDGSNNHDHHIPPDRRGGFDYWMGFENNNNQNETFVYGSDHEEPRRLPGYETDSLTDLFLEHVRDHVQPEGSGEAGEYQPFFAALSVQPPHNPYVPPTNTQDGRDYYKHPAEIEFRPNVPHVDWIRKEAAEDLAGYYGMIENIDYNLGRIRLALKEMGIDRETYIVFFSDHGDMVGSHGQWAKSSPWEEAIKIPFIVGIVGGNFHMRVGESDAVVNHVDIAPTTLGLCGIEKPEWMVGHDYSRQCIKPGRPEYRESGATGGTGDEPDSAYLQQIPRKMHAHSVNRAWRAVLMRDGWKYVCTPNNDWLLHDTKRDPYEMANLAYDRMFQKEKERCHARLERWIDETGDEFELPDISLDYADPCG